jgi:hypothetical protein
MCGAAARGSLGAPGWRPALGVLGAVAVLVLGAAAAAYAAFDKGASGRTVTTTVAQAPPPTSGTPSTPATTTPPPTTHGTTTTPKAGSGLPGLGGAAKPPKIPLSASTPKPAGAGTTSTPTTPASTTPSSTTPAGTTPAGSSEKAQAEKPTAILLDTNAAATYDPYEYPAAWFGDPSLAIDGDTSTAWTAQVNPATAPKMAVGLLIDLKEKQKVSALQLVTSTPGITVQVYGTSAQTAPTSITDPAWSTLTGQKLAKKKRLHLKLRDSHKAFTFITLWISKAPSSALGTAQAPGHVDVNEVELLPTS